MSKTSSVLSSNDTVELFFKTLETETTALFEQLDLSFLTDYPVLAPDDALAVNTPRWMIGDSEFDMLAWHDRLRQQVVLPIAPYNPRNTNDPLGIDYRVEERIKEHSNVVRLWQKQLKETYSYRSQVETAIGVYKDLGLGTQVRGRVRVKAHVFLALSLRSAVALANHHRKKDVASPIITL